MRENKKLLGRSIEERPDIDDKLEFGHWEADLVIGQKTNNDEALLTLLERQTRKYILVKIDGKTASAVMDGFEKVRKYFGSKFSDVFKSITTDNGSEFTELSNLEKGSKTLVYYAHPYSSKFKIAGYNASKIELLAMKDDAHVLAIIYDAAEDKAQGISGDKKNVDVWTAKKLAD